MKQSVRVSFDIPEKDHNRIKTSCVRRRRSLKSCLQEFVLDGIKKVEEEELNESLRKAFKQSEEGKARIITDEELDEMAGND